MKLSNIQKKVLGVVKPNALISRTVWSTPQAGMLGRKNCCYICKYFVKSYPDAEYDPAIQKTYAECTAGKCSHIRILAAYGERTAHVKTYFYCNMFVFNEEKEKENGNK